MGIIQHSRAGYRRRYSGKEVVCLVDPFFRGTGVQRNLVHRSGAGDLRKLISMMDGDGASVDSLPHVAAYAAHPALWRATNSVKRAAFPPEPRCWLAVRNTFVPVAKTSSRA